MSRKYFLDDPMSSWLTLLAGTPPGDRLAAMAPGRDRSSDRGSLERSNFALYQGKDHVTGWRESNSHDQPGRRRMQIR
jgi:hypothetical protein